LLGVVVGQQLVQRRLHEIRICVIFGEVFVRKPLGLDHHMERVCRSRPHGLEIITLQDLQHLKRRGPLAVRRQLVDVIAAILHRDRLDPFALVRGEIGQPQIAPNPAEIRIHRARELTLVESIAPALRQSLVRAREIGVLEHLTLDGRRPVHEIGPLRILELFNIGRTR
jgi:hypothetical protein